MQLVSFDDFLVGALRGADVVDLSLVIGAAARLPWDERLPAVASDYPKLRAALERHMLRAPGVPVTSVRMRAPAPRPSKLLCAIGNYGARLGSESPLQVDFTFKSPESIIGPGDSVMLGSIPASRFEAEATLAVVIGREARRIAQTDALSYVFGYTAMIDVFAAGLGRPRVGTFFGKSADTLGPMGPNVTTANELGDPQPLDVRLTVNGGTFQRFNTSQMAESVADVLTAAAGIMTLHPGDVVTCGSPDDAPVEIHPGDEVAVEIERIGRLAVRVEAGT